MRRPSFANGRWIPWVFVAAFGVVFLANGALVYLGAKSWTGLETEDPYEKGIAYNRALAGARDQAARGWQLAADFAGRAADGRLTVSLRDRDGQPLTGARVRVLFVRPTHEGFDREAALAALGAGRYGADIALPLAGQWDLRLLVSHDGASHQAVRRLHIAP